jgi:cobalt-zinc-cadmium efflux system membrane fusion protein
MNLRKSILFPVLLMTIGLSCQQQPEQQESTGNLTEITPEQFSSDSMQMGRAETRIFEALVTCNGYLVPLPAAHASVSLPLKGIITEVRCAEGQRVDKGYRLLKVSGHALIDLQQDFAQSAANFKRQKTSFERISALFREKVGSEKEYQSAEADFLSAKASYEALKLKIESLGLQPGAIEKGEFSPVYHVVAPISGFISGLSASVGMNTSEDTPLLEITDPGNLKLKLTIFPGDVQKIAPGQKVRYHYPGDQTTQQAEIAWMGKVLSEDSKSVYCFASPLEKSDNHQVVNAFVEAQIITDQDSALAVPSGAVVKSGSNHYLFVLDHQTKETWYFKKVQVHPGKTNSLFTEIHGLTGEEKILVRGAGNLPVD